MESWSGARHNGVVSKAGVTADLSNAVLYLTFDQAFSHKSTTDIGCLRRLYERVAEHVSV